MSNTRDNDIDELKTLTELLLEKEKEYNDVANAYVSAQHDLYRIQHASDKSEIHKNADELLKQLSIFKENLDSPRIKELQADITALSLRIEKLQKTYGNENSDSPSILTKKQT